ncbi:MAG: class II aldolase/adducin family protein [Endomicrobiia bacterium]
MTLSKLKKEIIEVSRYLVIKNYIDIFDGNISCRINNNQILITPKRKNKYKLSLEDLVVIDYDGKKIQGKNEPSGEWRLHCMVYKERQDVNSVVHTHPLFSVALSVAGISFNKPILAETVSFVENIKEIKYVCFYTEKLAENIKRFVKTSNIFLLKNHGLVTLGKTLDEALFFTEKIEHLAKTIFVLKMLRKKIKRLSNKEIEEIKNLVLKT